MVKGKNKAQASQLFPAATSQDQVTATAASCLRSIGAFADTASSLPTERAPAQAKAHLSWLEIMLPES